MAVRSVPEPVDTDRLRAFTLPELRDYRRRLGLEEQRVSYWRRLVQARLDIAAAGRFEAALGPKQIAAALGACYRSGGRQAAIPIEPFDDLPPLPDLVQLWSTPLAPHGAEEDSPVIHALAEAEMMLSHYRSALHRRLDAATRELIRRYRLDPTACLEVLPLDDHAERAAG